MGNISLIKFTVLFKFLTILDGTLFAFAFSHATMPAGIGNGGCVVVEGGRVVVEGALVVVNGAPVVVEGALVVVVNGVPVVVVNGVPVVVDEPWFCIS